MPIIQDLTIVHETSLLKSVTRTGVDKYWQGFVGTQGDNVYTFTKAYQEKVVGVPVSQLVSTPKQIEGKNVGRANETTPLQQAISEIESAASRKIDKGYYDAAGPEPKTRPLPMLAHNFEKRSHNIDWENGVYLQPKLDGVRMLFDGTLGWSRQGKDFIPEVIQHLQVDLPDGVILDGELMLDHRDYTFQETMKTIKKYRGDDHPKLEYHVYDIVDESAPFKDRWLRLAILAERSDWPSYIKLVQTESSPSVEDMKEWHGIFTEDGFEGTILRNAAGPYHAGHRSADLQKFKEFIDDEFEIVGVEEGVAKEEGCAIFICQTADGQTFKARPRGTTADRKEMYDNRDELIGNLLTVRYQNLSDDGIPRFPVGIGIQEDHQVA